MLTQLASLPIIQAPQLQKFDWLLHGFGLKDISIENYICEAGLKNPIIPKTHQPHGNTVHVLGPRSMVHGPVLEGDAFVTKEPGMVCWVRTADCLPILLADPKNKAVGAVHSGWKGTAGQVVLETIAAMKKSFGTDPKDLIAALGPAIGGRCYQVGVDVVEAFKKTGLCPGPWMEEVDRGHWYLDIAFANLHLLKTAGLRKENTYLSLACTSCDLEKFHSFREEKGKKGEQVSFVAMLSS
ncbi:MAG: peptidoglycan editing factor PgeF [Deltaproteobacteria bacterium]|nr:peptidoglycan editing factor PgeF [Deltaproteobacteria bacterium]